MGPAVPAVLGGVTVVTVSGGSWGGREVLADGLGGAVGFGREGTGVSVVSVVTVVTGAPRVALVDALSPLLMMTAVAMAPTATTAPIIAAAGRHRRSAGQASSP
jgi:hypothetical protein